MAKKVTGYIKLQIPAGKANPSPPVGPALGQRGLNIMEFCKAFNAADAEGRTRHADPGGHHGLRGSARFSFITKTPPVSYFLKKAAKIEKGSTTPGKGDVVGQVTWDQLREIAKVKMKDLNAHDVEAACAMLRGSALAMGLKVIGEPKAA